jgi:hypothetical protein
MSAERNRRYDHHPARDSGSHIRAPEDEDDELLVLIHRGTDAHNQLDGDRSPTKARGLVRTNDHAARARPRRRYGMAGMAEQHPGLLYENDRPAMVRN